MKYQKKLKRIFGLNQYEMIDFPKTFSNVRISRIVNGNAMGCSYCFPHGIETINSKYDNPTKNWKRYRKTQYRSV